MDDPESRRSVCLDFDSNIVVEAGAGTGKTSLLIDRILALVLAGDGGAGIPVESVVALTFTQKAAAEIKTRLADRLYEICSSEENSRAWDEVPLLKELRRRAKPPGESLAARARLALDRLDLAPIGTMHALASRLLKLHPFEAGLAPSFEVDEGAFFDRLFESEWRSWLSLELGDDPPRPGEWLEALKSVDLEDLKSLAKEFSRETADPEALAAPDKAAAAALEDLARGLDAVSKNNPVPRASSILRSLQDLSARLRALAESCRGKISGDFLESSGPSLKTPSYSRWPSAWSGDERGRALYRKAAQIARRSSPESERLLRRSATLLAPLARLVRSRFRISGKISYDGLLRECRDLLRENKKVRESLKCSYRTFLVDEFQDIDPLQGEILFFLAEGLGKSAGSWDKVRLGPGRLFVVGDPKQSIYRFRGADLAAYQKFSRSILSDSSSKAFALTRNFRSAPGILGPVNAVFSKIMVFQEGLQAAHQDLIAARLPDRSPENQPSHPAVEMTVLDAESQDSRRLEASWIADWIESHCGEGGARHYKDVAVLWRSAQAAAALIGVLKERSIPYSAQLGAPFHETQEFIDFVNLLRVLDNPSDLVAQVGLLRSVYIGVDDETILRLGEAKALNYLKPLPKGMGAAPSLEAWRLVLRELHGNLGRMSLGDFMGSVFAGIPILGIAREAYHGAQSAFNLQKIARRAENGLEGATLKDFIEEISSPPSARRSPEISSLDEDFDCVRILTVHKAKGLEFPVVILPRASSRIRGGEFPRSLGDWGSARWGVSAPRAKLASASLSLLWADEKERLEHETTRLLYVAMTRAKEKLIVVGNEKPRPGSFTALLSRAGAWSGGENFSGSVALRKVSPGDLLQAPRPDRSEPQGSPEAPSPRNWARTWARRFEKVKRDLKPAVVSPTSLSVQAGRPSERTPMTGANRDRAALLGRLCHRVLKEIDFKAFGDLKALIAREMRSLEGPNSAACLKEISDEAERLLGSFLRSETARSIAESEILGREIPFAYDEGGTVFRGVMDLVCRRKNKLVVIDYKTGAVEEAFSGPSARDSAQGVVYKAAVEKALGVPAEFRLVFLRRLALQEPI